MERKRTKQAKHTAYSLLQKEEIEVVLEGVKVIVRIHMSYRHYPMHLEPHHVIFESNRDSYRSSSNSYTAEAFYSVLPTLASVSW